MSGEQIKPGYKRTEVGVIPEDWAVVPISSLIEKNSRITYGVVQPGMDDPRGVLFVRGGDVFDGVVNKDNLRRITHAVSKQYTRTRLRGGELLISLVGFPGECAIVPPELREANIARQVALARFPDKREFEPAFICHFLRSAAGKQLLLKDAFGSAQQVINLKDVNKLQIPIPNQHEEQRAIASAISNADALLAKLDQLIAKKRDIQQAAMQQLLTGQRRLPGFSGEWEVKRLGDLTDMGSGGTPPTGVPEYFGGQIPWVSIADMTKGGKVLLSTEKNLSERGLNNCAAQVFPGGTVLYAMYASIGECSIAGVPLATSQAILGIRPNRTLSTEFLYYHLLSTKESVKNMGQQGTQANLNAGMVRAFEIRLPSLTEQTAIASVLSDMDTELTALETRRDKARQLKQGMMQELLTGRIRLV